MPLRNPRRAVRQRNALEADRVASAIATGVRRAIPDAVIVCLPLVDGGEGFARAMATATGGSIRITKVTGPVGAPVDACLGWLGGDGVRTAVVEMAQAAGLRLVPPTARNPMRTTTHGVGELILAALDAARSAFWSAVGIPAPTTAAPAWRRHWAFG